MESIGIGIAGFGTVGSGVYKNLEKNGSLLRERTGASFSVRKVAVKNPGKKREVELPAGVVTPDWRDLVADPEIRVVVELMGGVEEPLQLFREAILAGKIVVTGNKALLAEHGHEIFQLANSKNVPLFYEAAVAGGIPIIQAVRHAFVGNRIESMQGILNGTSNYILTRMQDTGMDFAPALAEAQELGYAEADPALDINGWDAAHKAIILASLAYGKWIPSSQVYVQGIEGVTAYDIRFADMLGYKIKLIASIRAHEDGRIAVRVCPTLIPHEHVLASVSGVFNAIWLRGDVVGESLFYGRGAGQDPTSSSVIADLAQAAAVLGRGGNDRGFAAHDLYGDCLPMAESLSPYYLRLAVEDRPGVLAQIAGILANHDIGIASVMQSQGLIDGKLPLILMLHQARHGKMQEALAEISSLRCVLAEPRLFHVEPTKKV